MRHFPDCGCSGIWREKADMVRIDRQRVSSAMQADIERWTDAYPNASGFISRLYEQERQN